MFIFSQIAKHNWRWHIWVCLLGDSGRRRLHESCCVCPGRRARRACWATRALSLSPPRRSGGRRVRAALIQFHSLGRLSFMPFSCPPIKNAPRGLVGGRWEWRLGSFQRSPSIIQRRVWFGKWTGINKSCASLFVLGVVFFLFLYFFSGYFFSFFFFFRSFSF